MEQAITSATNFERQAASLQPLWTEAIERHRHGDTGGAIALYQRHLQLYPQDAAGWLNLGAALRRTQRFDAALVCYQRALRLRPLDAGVWSNLGNLWKELEQYEQSLRSHRRALELQPDRLLLRVSYAIALREAGHFETAGQVLDECLQQAPDRPDLLWERAVVRLHLGRYREAWPDYEARWHTGSLQMPALKSPRWQGERIGGKRMLLLAESSIGDTLWVARYISMLGRRGALLTLVCRAALHPVLRHLPVYLLDQKDERIECESYDFHCPLMSLPGLVDARGVSIPEPLAISVPEESRTAMRARIARHAGAMKIGIVWSGSAGFADNARRALRLVQVLPLATLPGVQLFSLQKGTPAEEIGRAGAAAFLVDIGSQLRDFGETAAAIEQLDLIVTTDSVVAHLAGSMAKPVLNLLQFSPYWIYGTGGDSTAWYPSMRLIRQRSPGNWNSVLEEVTRLVAIWAQRRERDQQRT